MLSREWRLLIFLHLMPWNWKDALLEVVVSKQHAILTLNVKYLRTLHQYHNVAYDLSWKQSSAHARLAQPYRWTSQPCLENPYISLIILHRPDINGSEPGSRAALESKCPLFVKQISMMAPLGGTTHPSEWLLFCVKHNKDSVGSHNATISTNVKTATMVDQWWTIGWKVQLG